MEAMAMACCCDLPNSNLCDSHQLCQLTEGYRGLDLKIRNGSWLIGNLDFNIQQDNFWLHNSSLVHLLAVLGFFHVLGFDVGIVLVFTCVHHSVACGIQFLHRWCWQKAALQSFVATCRSRLDDWLLTILYSCAQYMYILIYACIPMTNNGN